MLRSPSRAVSPRCLPGRGGARGISSAAAYRVRPQTVNRHIGPAWQGASPLRRRLAVATATTLRRPPHPLRCKELLSTTSLQCGRRAPSVYRVWHDRARARRKAAWCRCRKASAVAHSVWLLASWSVATVAAFPLRAPKCLNARPADATRGDCALAVASFGSCAWANGWTKKSVSELVEALHETDNDER